MIASAIFMAALALVASFLPHEVLAWLGAPAHGLLPAVVQIVGALLFGFAMTNWMAKGSMVGGIYNRPIVVGNTVHFVVGAITLAKVAFTGAAGALVILLAVAYLAFAVAFAGVMFGSPVAGGDGR